MKKNFILLLSILFCLTLSAQNPSQISRDKAWEIVKEKILLEDTTKVHVYTSNNICVAKSQIQTVYSEVESPDFNSWFFFIDDVPFGDWEHPCRYVFVNNSDGSFSVQNHRRPPLLDSMTCLLWKQAGMDENRSKKKMLMGQNDISNNTPNTATYDYAVIINGGMNKEYNLEKYWYHCSDVYKTLINRYGYIKDHIYVLMSDGTNPSDDMKKQDNTCCSSELDLDDDGVDDIQYAATKSSISQVFTLLQQRMTNKDNLFVYITDHGGENNNGSFMYLWNAEIMTPAELNTQLNKVNAAKINICLMQCRSGGFIPTLQASNRVITTSCASHEDAHGTLSYSDFAFHWISAVSGTSPTGYSANADSNNDGIVSMVEAYNYAFSHKNPHDTPQFSSTPTSLGNSLSLYNDIFYGTYYNGNSTKNIVPPSPLYTNYGGYVEIYSPNIIGATVTHEGVTPNYWSCNTSTGRIRTSFSPSTGGTIIVRINRNGTEYVLPIIATNNSNYLSIEMNNGLMMVSLIPGSGEEETIDKLNLLSVTSLKDDLVWTLEIYSALTGEIVYKQVISGDNQTIDTTGWKPGVYVVRAIIGDEVLSEKVVVK